MCSKPININLKKNSQEYPTISSDLNLDVNFDNLDEDQFDSLKTKAENLSEIVSKNQLRVQLNVVSFYGVNRKNKFDPVINNVMESLEIKGKQIYVPKSVRNIKIKGNEKNSYVLSEIVNTTFFEFESPVIHLTLTKCQNLVIKINEKSLTGIECINCSDIVIDCESHYFVRTTSSSHCEISGDLNENTLIDVKNCDDIYFNKERIEGNMYTEGRFKKRDGKLNLISSKEDFLFRRFATSLPNTTVIKMW